MKTHTHIQVRSRAAGRRILLVLLPALLGGLLVAAVGQAPNARSSSLAAPAASPAGFGYPVKPFHREHPIRAYLGEPRTVFHGPPTGRTLMSANGSFSFHQGVDIAAPDGTPVYPVMSGTVTRVSVEWVRVDSGNGNSFEYWHIHPRVTVGQHVDAYETVLGPIRRPEMHVHLTEYRNGRVVNPLGPGRLGPFTDTTKPQIRSITVRSAGAGNLPNFVRGRVDIFANALDMPTMRVPGLWANLPTIPEFMTWQVRSWTGKVVVPRHTAYDFRSTVPPNGDFWKIYARGTYQNMAVFGPHYSYLQAGDYVFKLTGTSLDTRTLRDGVYDVIVTAGDLRGNTSTLTQRFTIHNRPGWIGS